MPAFFVPPLNFRVAAEQTTRCFADSAAVIDDALTQPVPPTLQHPLASTPAQNASGTMSEDQLLFRLFQATRRSLTVRGLCDGLDRMMQQSSGRLGYSMRSARDLRWPLMIAVQRNSNEHQISENLAVIQSGLMGNLRYQAATTYFSTPQSTAVTVHQVLSDLSRKACQLHLV